MSPRSYKKDVFKGYEAVEAKEHGTAGEVTRQLGAIF